MRYEKASTRLRSRGTGQSGESGGIRGVIEMPERKNVSPGVSIIVEPEPNIIMKLFSELVTGGHKGLYMTRRLPSEVNTRPERGSVKYIWLPYKEAQSGADEAFALGSAIEKFLEESEGGVVAVDGIECLSSPNGGKPFVDMLGVVSRKALNQRAYVLVQTPGGALSEEGREKLVRAMGLPILAGDATG
jgi:hypothetical protein